MNNNISSPRVSFSSKFLIPRSINNVGVSKNLKFVSEKTLSKTSVGDALVQAKDIIKNEKTGEPGVVSFCGFSRAMDKMFFSLKLGKKEEISSVDRDSFVSSPKQILGLFDKMYGDCKVSINKEKKELRLHNKRRRQGMI